jgi:hypothetical protein
MLYEKGCRERTVAWCNCGCICLYMSVLGDDVEGGNVE